MADTRFVRLRQCWGQQRYTYVNPRHVVEVRQADNEEGKPTCLLVYGAHPDGVQIYGSAADVAEALADGSMGRLR